MLATAQLDPRLRERGLIVYATDLCQDFVEYAQRGIYPRIILDGMRPAEQVYFRLLDDQHVQVSDELRGSVRFLPAGPMQSFEADRVFDVTILLNVVLYMPAEQQSLVIDRIAQSNRHLLAASGFHFDRIKSDMVRNGYAPVRGDAVRIHNGWLDRRRDAPAGDETIPGKIFHPWSLHPYQPIDDHEFKYCALFEKHG